MEQKIPRSHHLLDRRTDGRTDDDVETITVLLLLLLLLDFFRTKPAITAEWMTDGGRDGRTGGLKRKEGKVIHDWDSRHVPHTHTHSRPPERRKTTKVLLPFLR